MKLLTELPKQPEILQDYMPWSKNIQATYSKWPAI
ncbi:hypothetical protein ACIQ7N_09335 [Lysinibacillus sp. NPDC095746]